MRKDEQTHLGRILAECVSRLEAMGPSGAASAGSPSDAGTSGEDRHDDLVASLAAVAERIRDVKHALDEDVERRQRRSPATAARDWRRPRLGILRHHPPVPLQVPLHYLRTDPPRDAPTISIVTPSYQQGRFIERTIHSVVSQRYPGLEYVVQDGGSSDETVSVLETFSERLSAWSSEPDDGQADAINRGFAGTSGEIMAYLNSDDLLLPGSLAYVAGYFVAHPEVDAVYGHRVLIDEHDRDIGRWVLPRHDDSVLPVIDFVPQETLFWRRGLWERAGGCIDANLSFAIDWDLLLRFQEAGARMARLPRYLGAFRVHAEQKTAREQDLCRAESDLLQQRVLGRTMGPEEIYARTQAYLRRHVLHHTAQRLVERLPLPRMDVRTAPREASSAAAETPAFDRR